MKRTIRNDKSLKRLHCQIIRDNSTNLTLNRIKFKLEDRIRYLTTHANNFNIPRTDIFKLGEIYAKLYWKTFPNDISAKKLKEYYISVMKIYDKYTKK